MADSPTESSWQSKLRPLLNILADGNLVVVLRNVLDMWDIWGQLRDRIGYHGMYEILDYPPPSTSRCNGR